MRPLEVMMMSRKSAGQKDFPLHQHDRTGLIVGYEDDDFRGVIGILHLYGGGTDCVALYYSGEMTDKIIDNPNGIFCKNAEGDKFEVNAVAVAAIPNKSMDGVMMAFTKIEEGE